MKHRLLRLLMCALIIVVPARAQWHSGAIAVDSVAKFTAIPNSLAFQLLGLPGEKITEPGTPGDVLASLKTFTDRHGRLGTGIGVTFAPYLVIRGNDLQISDYASSSAIRILSNSQISFGTAPSVNVDSSVDWAWGARVVLLNAGDGRLDPDLLERLAREVGAPFRVVPLPVLGAPSDALSRANIDTATSIATEINNLEPDELVPGSSARTSIAKRIERLRASDGSLADRIAAFLNDKAGEASLRATTTNLTTAARSIRSDDLDANRAWNNYSLELNVGSVYRAFTSEISESKTSRVAAWVSGSAGYGAFQAIGQLGYYTQALFTRDIDSIVMRPDTVNDRTDTLRLVRTDTLQHDSSGATAALMLRIGNDNLRLGIGTSAFNVGADNTHGTLTLATEIRLTKDAWVVASISGDFADRRRPSWSPGLTLKTTGSFLGL